MRATNLWKQWSLALLAGCCLGGGSLPAPARADDYSVPEAPQQAAIPDLLDEDEAARGHAIESAEDDPETEVVRERYPSMVLKIERQVVLDRDRNYVNHGPWTMYDPKGNLMGRGQFEMGEQHGTWNRWYTGDDAKMFADPFYQGFEKPFRAQVQLRAGKLHGAWTVFDARDRMASQWEFKDGVRHGKSMWWYPNGQLCREATFENGQLDGDLIDLNAKQQVVRRVVYVAGHELAKDMSWYEPGKKKAEGWTLRSREIVTPVYDWWKGEVVLGTAKQSQPGARHGEWIFWHANGERFARGEYHLGKQVGVWVWWHPTGQAMARGEFTEGLANGRWIWWHDNGHRQCIGSFALGKQVGLWSTWRDDGKLAVVHDFSAPAKQAEVDDADEQDESLETVAAPPVEDVPLPDLHALKHDLNSSIKRR